MDDKIEIRNLEIWTVLGVFSDERARRRPVLLNIGVICDISKAVASDNLADAVDYSRIRDTVVAEVEQSSFQLLESLASHVATVVLSFQGVLETTVTLDKPGALENCQSVAVTITRRRERGKNAEPI